MKRIKKLLALVLALALCLGLAPNLAVPVHAAGSDFVIENGVLKKYIGSSADVVIPSGVTEIDWNAFPGNLRTTIRSIVIPEGVTELPGMCFDSFTALERVVLPQSLTSIGGSAFQGCTALTSITIPAGVTEIGRWAFSQCTALTNVSLPSNPSISFGGGVFDGTPWLKNEGDANGGLVIIGDTLVGNSFYYADQFDLVIPQGVRVIAADALKSRWITGVTIPEGVEEIGEWAFSSCGKLTEIKLPSTVKVLGAHAFSSCTGLAEVTLPAGLTEIGNWAFDDCTNLKTATVLGANTILKSEVFPLDTTVRGWRSSDAERFANYYFMTFEPLDGPAQEEDVGGKESPVTADPNAKAAKTANAGKHNYGGVHAAPIRSYLYQRQDGNFTRVECLEGSSNVVVEVYDKYFNLLTHREIPTELTIWGGFFAGERYNFFIFGDSNEQEDNQKEVVRVVKYSKDWVRLDSWSGYGMNTRVPFDAASVRCAEKDGILTVRTGHEMFKSYDGLNHQSNWAFSIRESDMTSVTCAGNDNYSYVSHSFNQFVLVEEDGVMATLDHGDAYPRAFVVNIHPDYRRTVDSFDILLGLSDAASVPLVYFPGKIGQNYTGAVAGGFEASSTHYLASVTITAGVDAKGNSVSDSGVMVYAVDKKTHAVTKYQVATVGKNYLCNTQLVKFSDDKFLLMWGNVGAEDRGTIYYTFLNGAGRPMGTATTSYPVTAQGYLSDCKPILADGKAVWYSTGYYDGYLKPQEPTFYAMDGDGNIYAKPLASSRLPSSWARKQVDEAIRLGFAPYDLEGGYTKPTARFMFCRMADAVYSKTVPTPITPSVEFVDCFDSAVERMAAIGVVQGVGGNRFNPNGQLTREQAATMLYRLAAAAGKPLPDAAASFSDNGSISSWASKAVGAVQAAGIMNGVGNNRFAPKSSYTYEQSIITMMRMYHYLNQ